MRDLIPGGGRETAAARSAESGLHRAQVPAAAPLAAWAGRAPGNHQSAGKGKNGKTRKGSRGLRAAVVNAAHAAGRTNDTALGAR